MPLLTCTIFCCTFYAQVLIVWHRDYSKVGLPCASSFANCDYPNHSKFSNFSSNWAIGQFRLPFLRMRCKGAKSYGQLQQERQAGALQMEHLLRHSKCNNLVVFGVPESPAYSLPAQLARHMQGVLFQAAPASEQTTVRSAYRLGKWKEGQLKPRAVLVELMSIGAKHTAFQASSRLRAARIRLDEDLTPQQMQQRKGLSTDFQCLKARGYKPFFRGANLKYRDGPLIRKCARGEANKVVEAAAQAARATAPPPARQPRPQRTSVAINPSEVLHQAGVTMVSGTLGSLTATEAQAFDDVMGEFGASDGGV